MNQPARTATHVVKSQCKIIKRITPEISRKIIKGNHAGDSHMRDPKCTNVAPPQNNKYERTRGRTLHVCQRCLFPVKREVSIRPQFPLLHASHSVQHAVVPRSRLGDSRSPAPARSYHVRRRGGRGTRRESLRAHCLRRSDCDLRGSALYWRASTAHGRPGASDLERHLELRLYRREWRPHCSSTASNHARRHE